MKMFMKTITIASLILGASAVGTTALAHSNKHDNHYGQKHHDKYAYKKAHRHAKKHARKHAKKHYRKHMRKHIRNRSYVSYSYGISLRQLDYLTPIVYYGAPGVTVVYNQPIVITKKHAPRRHRRANVWY